MRHPILLLLNPWILAVGAGVAGWRLVKKTADQRRRLADAKDELLEQQRTIDRLRAEVARTRGAPGAQPGTA